MSRNRLGSFEHIVLLGVLRCGNRASVSDVREEILERTGEDVSTTGVHTAMNRLEGKGFIRSRGTGATDRGRPRFLFSLTAAGESSARDALSSIEAMAEGVFA